MSMIPLAMYTVGIVVVGFAGWLINGIKDALISANIHETGATYDFLTYIWTGLFIIYLIFGGLWLIKKYNETEYQQGGF